MVRNDQQVSDPVIQSILNTPGLPKANRPDQDTAGQLGDTVRRERGRLLTFIRRRLPDPDDAEDLLQDVFVELTEAYQLAKPIERVASWLFAVARNKISDWYRKRRPDTVRTSMDAADYDDDETPVLSNWLMVADTGSPEDEFFRETLMETLADALADLPAEQRDVFVQHELEGRSFKDMADEWNVSINTLLSRKRYAVKFLRERLQSLYDDFLAD